MTKVVNRGYVPTDKKEFNEKSIEKLKDACEDLYYLLNKNYKIKGASTFVGNHYMLSERQRLAMVRAVSSFEDLKIRNKNEIDINKLDSSTVNIDGFNTIITLEVALSKSILLKCMDGTIRDLAGLRGTYRIIDKTEIAVRHMLETLDEKKVKHANIYLDKPVSNSGKLKELILNLANNYDVIVEAIVINDVDRTLEKLDNIISSDAIILNKCNGFINLDRYILEKKIEDYWCIDLEMGEN